MTSVDKNFDNIATDVSRLVSGSTTGQIVDQARETWEVGATFSQSRADLAADVFGDYLHGVGAINDDMRDCRSDFAA